MIDMYSKAYELYHNLHSHIIIFPSYSVTFINNNKKYEKYCYSCWFHGADKRTWVKQCKNVGMLDRSDVRQKSRGMHRSCERHILLFPDNISRLRGSHDICGENIEYKKPKL